jgi:hypothetical protein
MIGTVRPRNLLLLALFSLALVGASEVRAQAYKYVDESGRVHFTDSLAAVPAQYRSQIELRDLPVRPGSGSATASSEGEPEGGFLATFWQSFDAGIAGHPPEQQEALRAWARSYLLPILVTGILSGLIGIAMTIHALTQARFLWAFGNFFIGLPVGIYVLAKLENQPVLVRLFLFGVWLAPVVIWIMGLQRLAASAAA